MGNIRSIMTLLLLAFVLTNAAAQTYQIRVVNARNFKAPARNWSNPDDVATYYVDLERHKHQEVTVYDYASYYRISYYQKEDDSIRVHGFDIDEPGTRFDKALYTWNRDTLNLHLFNSTTDAKTKTYKGFGRGRTSSLVTD